MFLIFNPSLTWSFLRLTFKSVCGPTLLFHLVSASISVILTNAKSLATDIEFFRHAVVMLQPNGQNSIIIVGGANMNGWNEKLSEDDLEVV
jgi:hypothetical protein